jgi:hypothetical protein
VRRSASFVRAQKQTQKKAREATPQEAVWAHCRETSIFGNWSECTYGCGRQGAQYRYVAKIHCQSTAKGTTQFRRRLSAVAPMAGSLSSERQGAGSAFTATATAAPAASASASAAGGSPSSSSQGAGQAMYSESGAAVSR